MANDSACVANAAIQGVSNTVPATRPLRKNATRALLAACGMCLLLIACSESHEQPAPQGKAMSNGKQQQAIFDVSMLSYYERSIFDVKLNGIDIGAAGDPPHGDHAGLVVGVTVPLGSQIISWRLSDSGNTVFAQNQPVLTEADARHQYLGVHVYPDNTVELVAEDHWPSNTEKGNAFLRAWGQKHGR